MKQTIFTFGTTASLCLLTPFLHAQEKEPVAKANKPLEKEAKIDEEEQVSPVEATVKTLTLGVLKDLAEKDAHLAPPEDQHEKIADTLVEEFKKKAPKWTKEDAKLLKEKKPLVKDFDKTIKAYEKLQEENQDFSVFTDKVKQKNLTELEKRALTDMLLFFEAQFKDEPRKRTKGVAAINNGKDTYIAIREYVIEEGKGLGELGDGKNANEVLRELFKLGYAVDEKPFFVKGIEGFKEGDGNIAGKQALAAGENVWAINAGVNLVTAKANMPVLLCPIKIVKGKLVADPKPFKGKVVVVYADGSAMAHDIGPKGEIMTEEGPLYSAKHPIWRDKEGRFTPPDFRLPAPLKQKPEKKK